MVNGEKVDLTISRMLGHKKDIPGSGQWQFNKKGDKNGCWNCSNWIYTLVFWNEDIGILNSKNNINIENAEKKRVVDMIR